MHATTDARVLAAALAAALVAGSLFAACGRGGSSGGGSPPKPPPPEDTVLDEHQVSPGVVVAITKLSGASGADGGFRAGDRVSVTFTLQKADGGPWGIAEMPHASALVSGPSFNYQRVIPEQTDVVARAEALDDGSFRYEFSDPIPAHYLPPLNDTPSFGTLQGELTGQALLAGTYTVGLSFAWDYTVAGIGYHSVGEATADFRFGGAAQLLHREVTRQENCNQCHVDLQAHQGLRRTVAMCVLCHTSGAEDLNDPAIGGGTPDTSVDLRVMVHKIHNARHLPSVNGVTVGPSGTLKYNGPGVPYVLAGADSGARDFSFVGFPVWPNRTEPMPKDLGYKNLSAAQQAVEDVVRTGITTCTVCHGDPDGPGPLGAPAQGTLVYAQPTQHACGACHDDVRFDQAYVVNGQTMDPQSDNSGCVGCHLVDGGGFFSPLAVKDAHLHPLKDPLYTGTTFLDFSNFPGLKLALTAASEAGSNDGSGTLDPGEKVAITFTVTDDSGTDYPPARLDSLSVAISGPSTNSNLLLQAAIPIALLAGPQPYTVLLPERRELEFVGDSSAATGDVFTTARAPHLALPGATTIVRVRTATAGGSSTLAAAAVPPANFVDVASSSGFARNDFVVVDDGVANREEYLQIQLVDGNRLWFSSPASPAYKAGTSVAHAAGATVKRVVLTTKSAGTDFALDAAAGTITELVEFGAGNAVVVSYTSDFVAPPRYPLAQNDSPDLDETWGEWRGRPLVDGTYRVALSAYAELDLNANGEDNFYRFAAPGSTLDVRFGSAATLAPYALVSSGANCNACHQELYYHDAGERGFDACITCHATAGSEDRPRYVSAGAPDTPGVTVNFRTLLHEIHRGSLLAQAATFTVVGSGPAPWPDDFTAHSYAQYLFPAMPGGTAQCTKCHGADNTAWIEPAPRDHPLGQGSPTRVWRAACATCHDSSVTQDHIDVNTTAAGDETCAVCHGPGKAFEVELVHKSR